MKYVIDIPDTENVIIKQNGIICRASDYVYINLPVSELKPYDPFTGCKAEIEHEQRKAWNLAVAIAKMQPNERADADMPDTQWHWMQYAEAREKYEAWVKKKDEIKVGDEIIRVQDDTKMIVTSIRDTNHFIEGITKDGITVGAYAGTKTGRHFPEVEALLEKLRDGDKQ